MLSKKLPLGLMTPSGPVSVTQSFDKLVTETVAYRNGLPVGIRGYTKPILEHVFRFSYSDGRKAYHSQSQSHYFGGGMMSFDGVLGFIAAQREDTPGSEIYRRIINDGAILLEGEYMELSFPPSDVIQFDSVVPFESLRPDHYFAGAVFFGADLTDTRLNVPYTDNIRTKLSELSRAYGLKPVTDETNGKFIFSDKSDKTNTPIDWRKWVSATTKHSFISYDSDIPRIYLLSDAVKRWEFVRGVFDFHWDCPRDTRDVKMELSGKYYKRLGFLQQVLRSLGINSRLSSVYDSKVDKPYRLTLITNPWNFTKCFNDVGTVSLITRWIGEMKLGESRLIYLKKIEYAGDAYVFKPILGKPKALYTTDDYLPAYSE